MLTYNSSVSRNENGFSLVEGIIGIAVLAVLGVTGAFFYHARQAHSDSLAKATVSASAKTQATDASIKPLNQTDIYALQNTPTTPPTQVAPSAKAAGSSGGTTVSSPTPTPTPTVAPTQAPAAAAQGAITISSDGCIVTAAGTPGLSLEVGAYTPRKGGSSTFTMPSSGTIVTSAGGIKSMTSYGQLTDANGKVIAYTQSSISVDSCPPAGTQM